MTIERIIIVPPFLSCGMRTNERTKKKKNLTHTSSVLMQSFSYCSWSVNASFFIWVRELSGSRSRPHFLFYWSDTFFEKSFFTFVLYYNRGKILASVVDMNPIYFYGEERMNLPSKFSFFINYPSKYLFYRHCKK